MKTTLSLLTGVASLAALLSGAAAQTATTDPVGYITINVNGGGTNAAPVFSNISPTLVNKVDFAGAVLTAAGTTLNFTGTPFTANAFNQVSPTQPAYYIEVTNGSGEGVWSNIASNTTSAVT